ncbi:MAG: gamma-glutamyl-gamma-aminobutyrate hydrolase family protein [Actinomycetales bacterium]|nr:gamma-glutamyl-gamma-aminobutyrate hydrolase family protein [Actinomycetales bacterium]
MSSSTPVIGLTSYLEPARWGAWELPAALVPEWYVELFRAGGADIVLLPPGTRADVIDRLDGLAMAGGADLDSTLYGQQPHETADVPRTSRDASELALYRRARKLGVPVLGICRGLQVMAVAHGGSLTQHLPEVSDLVHRERPGTFSDHEATFEPGSRLEEVYGTGPTIVNSSHHQAVESAGDLRVTGWAADGTIEACEDAAADFCVGVQWHPEHPERRSADLPLVAAFVAAAQRYRSEHHS